MITGYADHALDEMLGRINRVMEHNDIATADVAIGKQMTQGAGGAAEMNFIHQQIIANQQSALHGFRGNLESLHHKGDHKQRDYDDRQERLKAAVAGIDLRRDIFFLRFEDYMLFPLLGSIVKNNRRSGADFFFRNRSVFMGWNRRALLPGSARMRGIAIHLSGIAGGRRFQVAFRNVLFRINCHKL